LYLSKNKPKETIEYVIRLQDKERQILNDYMASETILNYSKAFDQFTSFENMYLLVTVIEIVTGKEILPGTPNDIYKIIDYLRERGGGLFRDPDGSTGFAGFWDVNLRKDFERFFGRD